jgi:hypothetical protein
MRENNNLLMVEKVARALGELREDIVFVGGAVVELYATDRAAPIVRPTEDVDCVVKAISRKEYEQFEKQIQDLGFRHDTREHSPLCRWRVDDLTVDLMPSDPEILGFGSRWLKCGVEHTMQQRVGGSFEIQLLSPPFFLASKLDALRHRGGEDLRGVPDFEDIIFVVDNRAELPSEVDESPEGVRSYVSSEFETLLDSSTIREDIISVSEWGTHNERTDHILAQMRSIARVVDR